MYQKTTARPTGRLWEGRPDDHHHSKWLSLFSEYKNPKRIIDLTFQGSGGTIIGIPWVFMFRVIAKRWEQVPAQGGLRWCFANSRTLCRCDTFVFHTYTRLKQPPVIWTWVNCKIAFLKAPQELEERLLLMVGSGHDKRSMSRAVCLNFGAALSRETPTLPRGHKRTWCKSRHCFLAWIRHASCSGPKAQSSNSNRPAESIQVGRVVGNSFSLSV